MHTKEFDGITPYNIIIEVHRHYLAFYTIFQYKHMET